MLVIDVMMSRQNSTGGPYHHIPVMLNEVLETLTLRGGNVYVDGTFGGGGHSRAILENSDCHLIATDRDKNSIQYAEDLRDSHGDRFSFFISKFSKIPDLLRDSSINRVDGILLDLGVSSFQLDDPKRGFSFQSDGPLDMRMGENSLSAYDVVNKLKEIHLAEIIRDFGEERHARLVARRICEYRESKKIETTLELTKIIENTIGNFYKKQPGKSIHPATRTFQAIRILVNNEMQEIINLLSNLTNYLNQGGRVVVITFHSIEDRIVKNIFTHLTESAISKSRYEPSRKSILDSPFIYPTKKFLIPQETEITLNPRSRSAKLRCIERTDSLFRENLDIYSMNKYEEIIRVLV